MFGISEMLHGIVQVHQHLRILRIYTRHGNTTSMACSSIVSPGRAHFSWRARGIILCSHHGKALKEQWYVPTPRICFFRTSPIITTDIHNSWNFACNLQHSTFSEYYSRRKLPDSILRFERIAIAYKMFPQ